MARLEEPIAPQEVRTGFQMTGSPVIAVTIIDCVPESDRFGEVLLVVRNPQTNATHPGTVSVPTQRVPPAVLPLLTRTEVSERWSSNERLSGHKAEIFVVESVLARKLGLADALEAGTIAFEAR